MFSNNKEKSDSLVTDIEIRMVLLSFMYFSESIKSNATYTTGHNIKHDVISNNE